MVVKGAMPAADRAPERNSEVLGLPLVEALSQIRVPMSHFHNEETFRALDQSLMDLALGVSPGDRCHMHRLVLKLLDGNQSVHVVKFGGSVQVGTGCKEPNDNVTAGIFKIPGGRHSTNGCNYGGILARRLKRTFPANIFYHNYAESGTNSAVHAQQLITRIDTEGFFGDLVILDHSTNDAKTKPNVVGSGLEPSIRALRCKATDSTIVVSCMLPEKGAMRSRDVSQVYTAKAKHYNLTLVDTYSVSKKFADVYSPPDAYHPAWTTHHYVADMIATAMNRALDELASDLATVDAVRHAPCAAPLKRRSALECEDVPWQSAEQQALAASAAMMVCKPLSAYYADASKYAATPRGPKLPADGSWRLYEDRPGKPGWITETTSRSWISFDLYLNKWSPTVRIDYLRSYENLGQVEVKLSSMGQGYILDGLWNSTSSQTDSWRVLVDAPIDRKRIKQNGTTSSDSNREFGFGYRSSARRGVTLQMRLISGPKFKIVSVITC
mmetsp:Transcript_66672/g.216989  ORF Transcript_66672/g.216989 Transcript_66672/m.216989 type:complete len:497 (+) Transcript_66672:229-1719(+)